MAHDASEDTGPDSEQAEHVALGYPTPHGWVVPGAGPTVGHADVGEPADMRRVKAPVDSDAVDPAVSDVPMVTEVSVITGAE